MAFQIELCPPDFKSLRIPQLRIVSAACCGRLAFSGELITINLCSEVRNFFMSLSMPKNLLLSLALCAFSSIQGAEVESLENTNWQLIKMTVLGGYVFEPEEPSKYYINFRSDNRLTGSSDCNEIGGSWFQNGDSLKFEPFAASRKLCVPGSLHNNFALLMRDVQSMEVRGGLLLLKTSSEGLVLEFEAR